MPMVWDAALAATVASALQDRLAGGSVRAVHFDYDAHRLRLHLREATLLVRLHPAEAGLVLLDASDPPAEARSLACRLRAVRTPPDDRLLIIELTRRRGSTGRLDLILELRKGRANAALTEGKSRIVRHVLRRRGGETPLQVGHAYPFPPASDREGIATPPSLDRWLEVLASLAPGDRRRALLSTFAWTSVLNADALSGDLEAGWALLARIGSVARGETPAEPGLLNTAPDAQPYPVPLPGVAGSWRPAADLLDAFREAATTGTRADLAPPLPAGLLVRLADRMERSRGRVASLEEELAAAPDPAATRVLGDLLLARLAEVPRGAASVELEGFDGSAVDIELDPSLAPEANARAYYDRAARGERAQARLPGLIAEARQEWATAEALLERARAGEATEDEVRAAVPEGRPVRGSQSSALPYRRYRSSGGLEIRVGRGSRRNDDLTFRHSAPEDIWLHARDAAGAHVILRWRGADNPPARDLAEAAVLAALHSRARTSGTAPVDWTRRKHVRKPRKAPPGSVVPARVQTLFVEPDPALEERLRVE